MTTRGTMWRRFRASVGKARPNKLYVANLATALGALVISAAANGQSPADPLVITQTPLRSAQTNTPADLLDQRYPAGSRVVLLPKSAKASDVVVLSKGLVSAGAPVVTPRADRIYFAGKRSPSDSWQIFENQPSGGTPKQVTSFAGGAMDPALISGGGLVFSGPVPKPGATWLPVQAPALYLQPGQGPARRLTFGSTAAVEPTVLRDGRILFVSARHTSADLQTDVALFTVNDDGTEITAFALDKDGPRYAHRPRELLDGRVGFLATDSAMPDGDLRLEGVRTARPFLSRTNLFAFPVTECRAVEPDGTGSLLVCLNTRGLMGRSMGGSFGVFRITPESRGPGEPVFDDPNWNEVEAIPLRPHANPMGHVSAIMPAKNYATILCLDANYIRDRTATGSQPKTERVRVLANDKTGNSVVLGEVPVQADGSFMAEVPIDTPLGFESLGADGKVLQRSEPFFWVRPGENRSCIGCHEPYNRTMRNIRPMAASLPPTVFKTPTSTPPSLTSNR